MDPGHLLLANMANMIAKPQRKTVEVLVNPRGLSVDVLNDDTGGLLSSRARGHTYPIRLTHEAEASNNPRTEAHEGSLVFGLSNVGESY